MAPVKPRQKSGLPVLDCRESGSTLRFLLPLAAALGGAILTGKGRLPERPLSHLVSEMKAHGAHFSGDSIPLSVSGTFTAGCFSLPGNVSSQYVTGLMLAAPLLGECRIVIEGELQSADYVYMTASAMRQFGIDIEMRESVISIASGQRYISPGIIQAGGDWSGAAFALCLGVLGGPVRAEGISASSEQGDRRIMDILKEVGGNIQASENECTASSGFLHGIKVDVSGIPDLVPALAAVMMHAEGQTEFMDAGRLRLKESDRLATTCAMVNALGGHARVIGDSLMIDGRHECSGGTVDGAGDHRIIMAAAVGASGCSGPSTIMGIDPVSKSWPLFFDEIQQAGGKIDVVNIR